MRHKQKRDLSAGSLHQQWQNRKPGMPLRTPELVSEDLDPLALVLQGCSQGAGHAEDAGVQQVLCCQMLALHPAV